MTKRECLTLEGNLVKMAIIMRHVWTLFALVAFVCALTEARNTDYPQKCKHIGLPLRENQAEY